MTVTALIAASACKGKDKNESVATNPTATASSGETNATEKTTETAEKEKEKAKPATSGCDWPEHGDHDITITKGCAVTAKSGLTLTDGVTMTIEEGVKIAFDTDVLLSVEYGKLVVKGTASAPVTFTSSNKSPAAGDWIGLDFKEKTMAGTSLDHLIVEYAGSSGYGGVAGIHLEEMRAGGRISITNTTVRSGAQYGIYAEKNALFAKFENNTFKENKKGSAHVVAEVLGSVGRGNTFNDPIHVDDSEVHQTTTWPPFDVPVIVDGQIKISSKSSVPTLTIADKTTLKLGQDRLISVAEDGAGALVAKNVTFTSASPSPSPGDWDGIVLHAKSNGTDIENCTFEYFGNGGYGSNGAITLVDTTAKDLTGVTIKNNTFRKGKLQVMSSSDGNCAPFDKQNKADGVPFCSKP